MVIHQLVYVRYVQLAVQHVLMELLSLVQPVKLYLELLIISIMAMRVYLHVLIQLEDYLNMVIQVQVVVQLVILHVLHVMVEMLIIA